MLVLKYMRRGQVKAASQPPSQLLDKWIHLAPTTPHIVKAYDVLEDYNDVYLQVIEFIPNAKNLFMAIKERHADINTSEAVKPEICKFCYRFVI